MPLGAREILLTIRARDLASQTLLNFSKAFGGIQGQTAAATAAMEAHAAKQRALGMGLATTGAAMVGLGAVGVAFYRKAVVAAIDYQKQVALTQTQTQGLGISQKQLSEQGLNIAKSIGVPFEEIQKGLYNIYSSMTVTYGQATTLMQLFAKEAVAGQLTIDDASRSTIGVLNAYHLPLSETGHILDLQFQLVARGVGTYANFANAMGRAIPSAVRAGQSFETLSTVVGYLTRNHLSAANAVTSTARALEAFTKPTVIGRLHDMGVEVLDQAGKFRNIIDIVSELSAKMATLNPGQRNQLLTDLFKGAGGTIQARRMIDLVTTTKGAAGLRDFAKNFTPDAVKGQADIAFQTMSGTDANKLLVFKNNLRALAISIGQDVLPVLVILAGYINNVVKWFERLDPKTRRTIAVMGLFGTAGAIVVGALILITGAILVLASAFVGLDIAMGPLLLIIAGVILAMGLLGLVAFLVIRHWSVVSTFFQFMWQTIKLIFLRGTQYIFLAFMTIAGGILHAAVLMFGWVPGVGPKLKEAERAFNQFKDKVNADFNAASATAEAAMKRLAKSTKDVAAVTGPAGATAAHVFRTNLQNGLLFLVATGGPFAAINGALALAVTSSARAGEAAGIAYVVNFANALQSISRIQMPNISGPNLGPAPGSRPSSPAPRRTPAPRPAPRAVPGTAF